MNRDRLLLLNKNNLIKLKTFFLLSANPKKVCGYENFILLFQSVVGHWSKQHEVSSGFIVRVHLDDCQHSVCWGSMRLFCWFDASDCCKSENELFWSVLKMFNFVNSLFCQSQAWFISHNLIHTLRNNKPMKWQFHQIILIINIIENHKEIIEILNKSMNKSYKLLFNCSFIN